eukprot:g10776.t1
MPVGSEEGLQARRSLEDHVVLLGGELMDTLWNVEVTYKMKHKKKKVLGSEMRFGVNTAAPFVGMKRENGNDYPFTKQYCIRSSNDRGSRVMVVQEMADESPSLPGGKLKDVLDMEGRHDIDAISATNGLVTRLRATIEGHAFLLGDYIIRVGQCRKGAVYRGLCLEVEYLPAVRVVDGLAMINALIPSIDGNFVPTSDLRDPRLFGTEPMYSARHSALQTTDLFNKVFA